jgi:hypothetical protein
MWGFSLQDGCICIEKWFKDVTVEVSGTSRTQVEPQAQRNQPKRGNRAVLTPILDV